MINPIGLRKRQGELCNSFKGKKIPKIGVGMSGGGASLRRLIFLRTLRAKER